VIFWRDSQSAGSVNQVVSRLFRALLCCLLTLRFHSSAFNRRYLGDLHVDIQTYLAVIDVLIFVEQEMPVGFATLLGHNSVLNFFSVQPQYLTNENIAY